MSVNINIKISEDKTKIALGFISDGLETGKLELSQKELEDFIRILGTMRWAMAEGQKIPDIAGAKLVPAKQVKWAVQISEENKSTLLAFQHPAYGPVGFMLGDKEIDEYFEAVQKIIGVRKTSLIKDIKSNSKVKSASKIELPLEAANKTKTKVNSPPDIEASLKTTSKASSHTHAKLKTKNGLRSQSKLKKSKLSV